MAAAGEEAMWRLFEQIPGPVLVVRGGESDLLSRETVARMKERAPSVTSVEIAGVGHAPAFLDAEQIAVARQFFVGES